MNKEQLVPTVELCKQLKEAGFPQKGCAFYWVKYFACTATDCEYSLTHDASNCHDKIAAPTSVEIGEWLPNYTLIEKSPVHGFFVQNQMECPGMNWTGNKLPNVLSETYLYLSRNGLLKEPPHA